MNTTHYVSEIIKELQSAVAQISTEESEKLVDGILKAKKVFVTGAGRSGFMGKSFVMRMMHMGIDAYAIGETVTPNFEKDDILIIGSGSGETKSLISIAEKAKSIGGTIVAVTLFPESTIGSLADFTVKLAGASKEQSGENKQTIQPMGSLFEQNLLLFYDGVVLSFMDKKGMDSQKMYGRHANLE